MAMAAAAEALVCEAERLLTLSDYVAAEKTSAQACKLASPAHRELLDRACTVAIQSQFETQRFGLTHRMLRDAFGDVAAAPPHSLLLWLALALDSPEHRREAERLIQLLLDARQPGSDARAEPGAALGAASVPAWTRRQYLALLHLYSEVLLRTLREPAAVMRWVRDTQLPITQEEREELLEQLRQEEPQDPGQRGDGWEGGQGGRRRSALAAAGGAEQPPLLGPARDEEADEGRSFQAAAAAPQRAQRAVAASPALCEIEPQPAAEDSAGQPAAGLHWLAQCQQGAAALLRPLLGFPGSEAAAEGKPGQAAAAPPPAAAVGQLSRTVLGFVLLYALYAERAAIRRGMRGVRRFAAGGAADLLRMAFALSANPMAALGA